MHDTIVTRILGHAHRNPSKPALVFIAENETEETRLSYGDLIGRASGLASRLAARHAVGSRAALILNSGADYVVGVIACFLSGLAAVPLYPPAGRRSLEKLAEILAHSGARVAITTDAIAAKLTAQGCDLSWRGLEVMGEACSNSSVHPATFIRDVAPDQLAIVQFTSGSTAAPKGVAITHGNLLCNQEMIQSAFEHDAEAIVVSWLPPYHDMGLIGCILQPFFVGGTCVLMAPTTFTQDPSRWLRAIARYRATTSGAPNFGYQICVDRVSVAARASLDLSSWSLAFCGAEPIREKTMRDFARTFLPSKFRAEALYPCYGLAEATLFVTGARKHRGAKAAVHPTSSRRVVCCGAPRPPCEVRIVDPQTCKVLPSGLEGEIWIGGPNVAEGYWNDADATNVHFHAHLAENGAPRYLRTGDCGYLVRGELYVSGRIKDVVVVRGRKLAAGELEQAIETSHRLLSIGSCAIFNAMVDEGVVAACELQGREPAEYDELFAVVRAVLVRDYQFAIDEIVLVRKGSLPRTTSGKIEKFRCRKIHHEAGLLSYAVWRSSRGTVVEAATDETTLAFLVRWLTARIPGLAAETPLWEAGVDSLVLAQLQRLIHERFNVTVPHEDYYGAGGSVRWLASRIDELQKQACAPVSGLTSTTSGVQPTSFGQRSLWLLNQISPAEPVCNVVRILQFDSMLDEIRLERTFRSIVERHGQLRSVLTVKGSELVYEELPVGPRPIVRVHHLRGVSDQIVQDWVLEHCYCPFDLKHGPLFRVDYLKLSKGGVLALSAHHAVIDLWSLMLVLQDFKRGYENAGSLVEGVRPQYGNFVEKEREHVRRTVSEPVCWESDLFAKLVPASGSSARVLAASRFHSRTIRQVVSVRLEELKRRDDGMLTCTDFTLVATAFMLFLHASTSKDRITIGTMTSGRIQPEWADLVGYLANIVPLSVSIASTGSVADGHVRVQEAVRHAMRRQRYPYSKLPRAPGDAGVELMLSYQQLPPAQGGDDFSSVAMGLAGPAMTLGGALAHSREIEERSIQFKLILRVAVVDEKVALALDYQTAVVTDACARELLSGFARTLEALPELWNAPIRALVSKIGGSPACPVTVA